MVDRLRMEKLALAKESDAGSVTRLESLRRDLADRQEELAALMTRWDREKLGLNRVGELKKLLDDLRSQRHDVGPNCNEGLTDRGTRPSSAQPGLSQRPEV